MSELKIAGKYLLERQIGRGGMGVIWEALDLTLQRKVALKLMRQDHLPSAEARRRFEREALAVAQLKDQHVIQIHDYGIDALSPYIVMELLVGEDLEERLRRQKRLSLAALIPVITQTAKALSAAHAAGIIHRDLKPANIFLVRGEAEETVKILDFGITAMLAEAEQAEEEQAEPVTRMGTPPYMSPEQLRSLAVDQRGDLWALAVIAYQALTGQLPFWSETLGKLIVNICTDPLAPPSTLAQGLGPEIDAFFERALAKDPARRFQSARDLSAAFAALAVANKETRPAKILVIDDEPDVPLLIRQRFQRQIKAGVFDFLFAADGEAALAELRQSPDVDAVVSDINMPGMDGLTFLEKVAAVNPLLKTVIVSAYGDMGNIRSAMNRGAFDFLTKPINFKDLEATINKTVQHIRQLRSTARSAEENGVLRTFVSRRLLERLPAFGRALSIPSDVIEATVAFIDVCGISAVTRAAPADEAIRRLNANFEVIVPEVMAHGGEVDNFLGDAILAIFQGDGHLLQALDACVGVRARLRSLAARTGEGSPYRQGVAIGLSTGRMISCGVGSTAFGRLSYTVIGGVVNSASELLSMAQADQLLIDASTYRAVEGVFRGEPIEVTRSPEEAEPPVVYNVIARSTVREADPRATTLTDAAQRGA